MSNIVKYKNGNYHVMLDLDNGTKIRYNNDDELIPEFPESMDICISKRCSVGCVMCHEQCSPNGKHGDIMNAKFIDNLHPYTELALNGNEPLHPDLIPFLEKCKKLKLIPSLTVNQKTFMNNIDLLKSLYDRKYIYGMGVSFNSIHDPSMPSSHTSAFLSYLKWFPNAVVHIINGIVTIDELKLLSVNDFKLLILGYKRFGRGIGYYDNCNHEVEYKKSRLHDMLPQIIKEQWFNVVSFDNLAIEQLDVKNLMSDNEWQRFYCGDDGTFTFYVDLVNNKFAQSSTSIKRYDLLDDAKYMFDVIRSTKE